ncbi:PREDICTED: uncharacterized protein LOC109206009 [Nicotiana attenuata]|uniref:uncharacterized protein LOC109206009 n=1 Tax=Nicotiana attenuata TaxID=49451 RepID=UPI000905B4EA|nr:PREDICTED: uncharacterized protein LOC109206009 [Nicotiana attenuata]
MCCRRIKVEEVVGAMGKMSRGKVTGPDEIPVEFWRYAGRAGLEWLTGLFNIIFRTKRMPDEWRWSTMVPVYKNKGDIKNSWFDVGESGLHGPNLVQQAIEKVKFIRERLLTAQSRQKSYSDVRRRDLEFGVNDWYIGDPTRVVPTDDVQITEDLSYEEISVVILDRQIRKLQNKEIGSVKVLWRSKKVEEMTWEAEEEMKSKYPHLFLTEDMARGGILQHHSV